MRCEIDYNILRRKYLLYLFEDSQPDKPTKCITIHLKEEFVAEGFPPAESAAWPKEEGQAILKALADALFRAGFLPESATTAELKATKYHLEDMRKLGMRGLYEPGV
jgi:hypothetical protein